MNGYGVPNIWKAVHNGTSWVIKDQEGKTIATVTRSDNDESYAKLIAASPYTTEALKAMVKLIGDEDLPDNGELSGAAICDMARAAIELATGTAITET